MLKVLLTYFAIFFSWTVYRYFYQFSEPVDELIAKPLIFVLPVIWYIWQYEKGRWGKLGLKFRHLFRDLYFGIGLGMVLGIEGLFFNYLKYGELNFEPVLPVEGHGLYVFLGLSLSTAISEEILGRGFLYNQLRHYVSDVQAVFLSSVLFILLHLPIVIFVLHLSGIALVVYIVSVFVLSVVNCVLLRFSGSLLAPILVHAFWNMTIGLYL